MTRQREDLQRRLREALAAASKPQRFTRQRERVYRVLCSTTDHPTTEEVHRKVKQAIPKVSLATVYKALDTLVRCGLAQKLTYGDGSARYDANIQEHPHMRDLSTGQVLDVPPEVAGKLAVGLPPPVASEIEQQTGFKVIGVRVELLGYRGAPVAAY